MLDLATPLMTTLAILLGFTFVALIMQILNFIRTRNLEQELLFKLDQVITILNEDELKYEGSLVSFEDLIKRDLEENYQEDPDNLVPITDEELENIMTDIHRQSN